MARVKLYNPGPPGQGRPLGCTPPSRNRLALFSHTFLLAAIDNPGILRRKPRPRIKHEIRAEDKGIVAGAPLVAEATDAADSKKKRLHRCDWTFSKITGCACATARDEYSLATEF